jgi:DNA-binding NarL/FixJ family response regulator
MESTKDYRRAIVLAKEALILPTTKIRRVLHRTAAKILARSYAALGNRAESAKWKKFANESGRDELLGNMLSSQIRASLKPEQPTEPLTEHEIICLSMSAHGQTSTDIALKLGVKPRTINFHFTKILRKLNAMNRQEAIAKASEANLLRRL